MGNHGSKAAGDEHMCNLLSDNFSRLFKRKLFWTECILSALIGIILSIFVKASAPQENISVDELLLFYT